MQEKFSRRIITEEKFEKTLQRMESACLFAEMKTLSKNMRTYWGGVTLGMMDAIIRWAMEMKFPNIWVRW